MGSSTNYSRHSFRLRKDLEATPSVSALPPSHEAGLVPTSHFQPRAWPETHTQLHTRPRVGTVSAAFSWPEAKPPALCRSPMSPPGGATPSPPPQDKNSQGKHAVRHLNTPQEMGRRGLKNSSPGAHPRLSQPSEVHLQNRSAAQGLWALIPVRA